MPSHTAKPPAIVPDVDPAQFGVSASPEAMQRLVQAITACVTDGVIEQVKASLTASLTEEFEARFQERVQKLYEQLRLARQRQFGRSSEAHVGQAWLFDEADALA